MAVEIIVTVKNIVTGNYCDYIDCCDSRDYRHL